MARVTRTGTTVRGVRRVRGVPVARDWLTERYITVSTRPLAARGLAVLRVGYGSLWVLFLLREWVERDALWGPGSAWSPAMDRLYADRAPWSGVIRAWFTFVAGLSGTEFDLFYLFAAIVGIAFALGWHTRAAAILFAFAVVALENRAPMLTDGGDNVLTLMSIYLAFTSCGRHFSLDAARKARRERQRAEAEAAQGAAAEEQRRDVPAWRVELAEAWRRMLVIAHNGAVVAVAAQICVIYGTAGLLKVQGSMWQDGSALGYVLRLDWFQPWPGLSAWIAGHAFLIAIVGYVTVFVQAGFPFIVFSPRLKYPALAVLVGMHASIAVLLGLPFFSAIMLVGDAIFLPDRFWRALGRWLRGPAYARSMDDAANSAVRPTLVFDGDCGFCTASVNLAERWCRADVRFVPWQRLDLAAHGLTREQVEHSVQWLPVKADAPIRSGANAAAHVLLRSRWPWRPIGALMLVPPVSWIAAGAYRVIANNRYKLPGATPACAVPSARAPEAPEAPETDGSVPASAVTSASASLPASAQRLGDLGGGADDAGSGAGRVELAERDHAD